MRAQSPPGTRKRRRGFSSSKWLGVVLSAGISVSFYRVYQRATVTQTSTHLFDTPAITYAPSSRSNGSAAHGKIPSAFSQDATPLLLASSALKKVYIVAPPPRHAVSRLDDSASLLTAIRNHPRETDDESTKDNQSIFKGNNFSFMGIANSGDDGLSAICESSASTFNTIQAPTFILAGAQKAGTSALFMILRKHPNFLSSNRFEVHFFDRLPTVRNESSASILTEEQVCQYRRDYLNEFKVPKLMARQQMQQLMEGVTNNEKILRRNMLLTFEKSPVYLCLTAIPEHIKRISPWVKILILLRNPADRAYSEYKMNKESRLARNVTNMATFEYVVTRDILRLRYVNLTTAPGLPMYNWALNYSSDGTESQIEQIISEFNVTASFQIPGDLQDIDKRNHRIADMYTNEPRRRKMLQCGVVCRGLYAQQLARWLKHFELGQTILVIRYERFVEDRSAVLAEIFSFLGAPSLELRDEAALERSYSPHLKRQIEHQPLGNATREYLRRFYQPYNDELANMLGEEWRNVWE